MKIGDLVVAKIDCYKIHKGDICKIENIKGNMIFIKYSVNNIGAFHLKTSQRFYECFLDVFYTDKELRRLKLDKINEHVRTYKI